MAEHEFSPINSHDRLLGALNYLAIHVVDLGRLVLTKDLSLDTLTIFTHDQPEYDFVESIVRSYGEESKLTHGKTLYIESDFEIQGNHIRYLGVRRPDETRPQVGYGDFPVDNLNGIAEAYRANKFVREMESGRGQPMLELRHPDFDVLGYVVDASEH